MFSQSFLLVQTEESFANMLRWLILAALVVVCASEPEVEAAEAASPIRVLGYEKDYLRQEARETDLDDDEERDRREGHGERPIVGLLVDPSKLLRSQGHGKQDSHAEKIIKNVYSPDYYQPTWILDYRYLKTGGREYTRSDGGQVLILPHHVLSDEHTEFKNYDQLLEFLRVKQLSESKAHLLHPEDRKESYGYREREERREAPKWQRGWV